MVRRIDAPATAARFTKLGSEAIPRIFLYEPAVVEKSSSTSFDLAVVLWALRAAHISCTGKGQYTPGTVHRTPHGLRKIWLDLLSKGNFRYVRITIAPFT